MIPIKVALENISRGGSSIVTPDIVFDDDDADDSIEVDCD